MHFKRCSGDRTPRALTLSKLFAGICKWDTGDCEMVFTFVMINFLANRLHPFENMSLIFTKISHSLIIFAYDDLKQNNNLP